MENEYEERPCDQGRLYCLRDGKVMGGPYRLSHTRTFGPTSPPLSERLIARRQGESFEGAVLHRRLSRESHSKFETRSAGVPTPEGQALAAAWRRNSQPGPPMTLANMRLNGVRAVTATCEACGPAQADVNVDALPETITVPEAGQRLRCSQCGASTRPAWHTSRRQGFRTSSANAAAAVLGRLRRQPQKNHVAVARRKARQQIGLRRL